MPYILGRKKDEDDYEVTQKSNGFFGIQEDTTVAVDTPRIPQQKITQTSTPSSISDRSLNRDNRDRIIQTRAGGGKSDLGFFDAFTTDQFGKKGGEDYVPFLSSVDDALNYKNLISTAMKLNEGRSDFEEGELEKLQQFVEFNAEEKSWGYTVGSIIAELPAFAGEILAIGGTGGIAGAGKVGVAGGKKAAQEGLKAYLNKGLKEKLSKAITQESLKKSGKFVAKVEVVGAPRVVAATMQNQLSSELEVTAGTREQRESLWDSFVKGHNDTMVEYGTELVGGKVLSAAGKLLPNSPASVLEKVPKDVRGTAVQAGIISAFKRLNPAFDNKVVKTIMNRVGYHGIVGELAEERLGEAVQGVLYEFGLGSNEYEIPSIKQITAEIAAFSVPSAGFMALDKGTSLYKNIFGKIEDAKSQQEGDISIDTKDNPLPNEENKEKFQTRARVIEEDVPVVVKGKDVLESVQDIKTNIKSTRSFLEKEIADNDYVFQVVRVKDVLDSASIKNIAEFNIGSSNTDVNAPVVIDTNGDVLSGFEQLAYAAQNNRRTINTYLAVPAGTQFQTQESNFNDRPQNFGSINKNKARFLSTEEALSQASEIALFRELEAKQVQQILTPSGQKALGSYREGLIKFVSNPDATTLPHETFHGFVDLVATPKQKKSAFDAVRRRKGNEKLSDAQVEEILAQEFAEYFVSERTKPKGAVQRFFDFIRRQIKALYSDEAKIENLFNQVLDPNIASKIKKFNDAGGIESLREAYQENPVEFTTKIAKALGGLDKKEISYGFLKENVAKVKKTGLKAAERILVEETMEMPQFKDNKKINVEEFIREMTSELLEISLIDSNQYSNYGLDNIQREGSYDLGSDKTIILNTNFNHGVKGSHFGNEFDTYTRKEDIEIREIKAGEYDGQTVKKDQYFVVKKGLSDKDIQDGGVFGKFDTDSDAQEYIDNFADRRTTQAGMLAHYRRFKDDGIFHVVEFQSDVFQKDISPLIRSNENLRAARVYPIMQDIKRKKDSIEHYRKKIGSEENQASQDFYKNSVEQLEKDIPALEKDVAEINAEFEGKAEGIFFKQSLIKQRGDLENTRNIIKNGLDGNMKEFIDDLDKYSPMHFGLVLDSFNAREVVGDFYIDAKKLVDEDNYVDQEVSVLNSRQLEDIFLSEINDSEIDSENQMLVIDKLKKIDAFAKSEIGLLTEKIEKGLTNKEMKEIRLSNQFLNFKNNYHEVLIKTAIRDAADSGSDVVRFPTPMTVSFVEGYVDSTNEYGEASGRYSEGELSIGQSAETHLGEDGIVSGVDSDGYTIITSDGGTLNEYSEDDILQSELDNFESEFNYTSEAEDLLERWNSENETQYDSVDALEESQSEWFESEKELEVSRFKSEFDVDDFYDGIYGNNDGWVSYEQDGVKYYVDAGGSNIYESREAWSVEVDKDTFDITDITDNAYRTIAGKYGIDEYGNEGLFYKYLKKTRPDLQEVTDDNGFTWWESQIQPQDKGAVEMFQTFDDMSVDPKESEIDSLRLQKEIHDEARRQHPARELMRYVNKRTGDLPEINGLGGIFSRRGDEVYEELGFDSYDQANEAQKEYSKMVQFGKELTQKLRDKVAERKEELTPAYIKENYHINLKKQKIEDLYARYTDNPTQENREALSDMRKRLTRHKTFLKLREEYKEAGLDAGYAEGREQSSIYYKRLKEINDIARQIMLPNRLVKSITDPVNIQLMTDKSYAEFKEVFRKKAMVAKERDLALTEYKSLIQSNRLNKVDNLRLALGYPSIKNMTTDQLNTMIAEMKKYNDAEFLSVRKLQTIDNTQFAGIRTREELIQKVEEATGAPFTSLKGISSTWMDRITPDTILREKNPFYKLMVDEVQREMLKKEARMVKIREEVNELDKAARKSIQSSTGKKLVNFISPTNSKIIEYAESSDKQQYAQENAMTDAEIKYADYIIAYFARAYEYLKDHSDIKKRELYFPHMRKTFTENLIKDKSVLGAIKATFNEYKEDRASSAILDEATGEILAYEKFFKFAMQRTGEIDPSENISKVFLSYAETLETKKAVDSAVPLIGSIGDVITESKGKTDTGLPVDPSVTNFTKRFLNNKKGRKFDFGGFLPQGGSLDVTLKALQKTFSFMMIGGSIPIQVASFVGEVTLGVIPSLRQNTPKAVWRVLQSEIFNRRSMKDGMLHDETLIGRGFFDMFNEAGRSLPDKVMGSLYAGFVVGRNISNKLHAAGLMTKEEFMSGQLTEARHLEIINEMERFRETGVVKGASVVGSTSISESGLQFKSWAIRAVRRTLASSIGTIQALSDMATGKENPRELSGKEIAELATSLTMAYTLAAMFTQDEDYVCYGSAFECELQEKMKRESQSFIQAMTIFADPRTAAPSIQWFFGNLYDTVSLLDEQYKRDGKDFQEGDNKGVVKFERFITPRFIKQFRED